jgi:hypothetical protein
MKKLLILAVLLLMPLAAGARENEPLLTRDGALFSVQTQQSSETPDVETLATQYLVLETRRGADIQRQMIPATNSKGAHGSAALAYDAESKTLFVFWLHDTGTTASELLFASLDSSGVWSEATAFGMPYNVRENLRIAVTSKVLDKGEGKLVPGLSVHAAWWEFDSQRVDGSWSAQYALLAIQNGKVAEIDFFDLNGLIHGYGEGVGDVTTPSVLRHPQLFPAATQDSMLVIYGDLATNTIHQARIFPIKGNGRLRVPVGRRESGAVSAPSMSLSSNASVGSAYGDTDRMAFYAREGNALHYSILRDNAWSDTQTITLDAQITAPAAVEAIRRLLDH